MHSKTRSGLAFALATGCTIVVAFASCDAHAVTLTNKDSTAYSIEVTANSSRRQHEIAPGKSLARFCKRGCIIRLNGSADSDYTLEGTERVSIEGGLVYYDGEEIQPKDGTAPDQTDK